jgi:diguanylate cyclase (GGDEF)-like protein
LIDTLVWRFEIGRQMAGARAMAGAVARQRLQDRRALMMPAGYGLLGLYLLGYLAWLIVRGSDQSWPLFGSWTVAGFEIFVSLLCVARGLTARSGRAVPVTLGLGLLLWALGDLILAVESQGGVEPPTPSLADAFYLGFFPLTYVAVVLFMRGEVRRLATPSWLDGAVAGAGAAAVCAAFVFHGVLHAAGGGTAATATNIAYPVSDLLLLSLVVGGSTLMSGRRKAPWLLIVAGIAINVVGDTANLFHSSLGRSGLILDAIAWPASILLMSMAVWLRPRPINPLVAQKPATFLIPGLSASGALVVVLAGNLQEISRVAVALATVTLVLAGLRLIRSVRAMRALSQERQHQSITDELTGLNNRRFLSTVLDAFFADYDQSAPGSRGLACLFVDLDHFKDINDTYGHLAGDQVLKQLGPRLTACLRAEDLLVRLGGDEFVVLLLDADADYAVVVAQRLTEVLAEPFTLSLTEASVGASIGIALAPTDATDAHSLLWCADIAMYRAKLAGSPYVCYHHDRDLIGNRMQLLAELQTAIDEHHLFLHYQPQLDLRSGRIVSVECLVRWQHRKLGVVPPLDFLPFAEEAGLMGQLTALVLSDAITQCAEWRDQGIVLTISVNISPTNLLDPQFVPLVEHLLDRHGVPASALILELTETSVISDFERSQQVIQELLDVGVFVSVDDFGAGFTSLAYLSTLAVKELKLDRTLVSPLSGGANPRDLELVRSTIELGHALGLRIVAEGIEDGATLELLSALGCDLGQGYFIGRPTVASQLAVASPAPLPGFLPIAS